MPHGYLIYSIFVSSDKREREKMIPVVSFMKKVVGNEGSPGDGVGGIGGGEEGKLTKLRATLASGLSSAATLRRGDHQFSSLQACADAYSATPPVHFQASESGQTLLEKLEDRSMDANGSLKSKAGPSCRVCVKSIDEDEFHRTCMECKQLICEDCASYSEDQPEVRSIESFDQGGFRFTESKTAEI
ncbi:unnamed protein product [Darwinula stevensoni]|uniref:Uncharacterized protein n=1 Tax=Darwinula stevensoni TaxID=69355 RepID=A0A7R8ZXS8_9CRUS|nr:unnamed protein product [Darwinula stevensoni]CAG0879020.1 unnamed protein product [Darwinula stevensoni]